MVDELRLGNVGKSMPAKHRKASRFCEDIFDDDLPSFPGSLINCFNASAS